MSDDILGYALQGGFPENLVAATLKPDQLDQRFSDYRLLLDLHFILRDEVVQFVRRLPDRLRSIRTETASISRESRGRVDGHIQWGQTIETRFARNPRDRYLFVVENRSKNYDIPENIVLKHLLTVIHRTLDEAADLIDVKYEWITLGWLAEQDLIEEFRRIFQRNVHVSRIPEPATYEPDERMLITAETSRQDIYKDAAELVRTRERLHEGNEDELRRLLEETAIMPEGLDKQFELFVLFRVLDALHHLSDDSTYHTISRNRNQVATFFGEMEINVYYNQSGHDLSFKPEVSLDDIHEYSELSRSEQVPLRSREIANRYFDTKFSNYTGRPDVIALEINSETGDPRLLIIEVKNSDSRDTIRQGIRETVEYLAFAELGEQHVFDTNTEILGNGWNGLLVIQDLERDVSLESQVDSDIKILQASDLDNLLPEIIRRAVELPE